MNLNVISRSFFSFYNKNSNHEDVSSYTRFTYPFLDTGFATCTRFHRFSFVKWYCMYDLFHLNISLPDFLTFVATISLCFGSDQVLLSEVEVTSVLIKCNNGMREIKFLTIHIFSSEICGKQRKRLRNVSTINDHLFLLFFSQQFHS